MTTGSNIHTRLPVRLDLTDLDFERRYSRGPVYTRTKTLHMAWFAEHGRRLARDGSGIRFYIAPRGGDHPYEYRPSLTP